MVNYELVIDMAWQDHISFEEIHEKCGLSEAQVIVVMRTKLKSKSFKMWRRRVQNNPRKHLKKSLTCQNEQDLKTLQYEQVL